MPPPDKIRPLVEIGCREEGCEFRTTMEFAAFRHEDATGHRMVWWGADVADQVASSLGASYAWARDQLAGFIGYERRAL